MLENLMIVLRTFFARRTIAAIVGEIQQKIERLERAEAALLSYAGMTKENVVVARAAFHALEQKAKVEIAALTAEAHEAKLLRNKLI